VLRIRLRRVGKKKQPQYRLVVADSRAPRDGAFVESIGLYNPRTQPATIEIDEARAREWLGKGAIPSERVVKLFALKGLMAAPDFSGKPQKTSRKATAEAAS
jgi:small subunit ribosomal protein S16